jgi:hypothetical protein
VALLVLLILEAILYVLSSSRAKSFVLIFIS